MGMSSFSNSQPTIGSSSIHRGTTLLQPIKVGFYYLNLRLISFPYPRFLE